MKVVIYNSNMDIVVEFQDEYKGRVHTRWDHFINGSVKNPYLPRIYGKGMVGQKYPTSINKKNTKEYATWVNMLKRCYDEKAFITHPSYAYCDVCKEWFLFDNFYEWLHSQENFTQWKNNSDWDIDKDILVKNNKTYGPAYCSLVPNIVNMLFVKNKHIRGNCPIGVNYSKDKRRYMARCNNPLTGEREYLGEYNSDLFAFNAYKRRKEQIIQQVADQEYNQHNITKKCYEALINYIVEIDD